MHFNADVLQVSKNVISSNHHVEENTIQMKHERIKRRNFGLKVIFISCVTYLLYYDFLLFLLHKNVSNNTCYIPGYACTAQGQMDGSYVMIHC